MTRIAIISSPRSGNTWLRYLLARLYNADHVAVHTPEEADWETLPDDCVLQLHWHYSPAFHAMLEERGFRVIAIARHPLDVLISILHFAPNEPQTARWLDGACGDERPIFHVSPVSAEFLSYATGPRADALLSVSRAWWQAPDVTPVRYEDLVDDTIGCLFKLSGRFGPPAGSVSDIADALTLEKLRPSASNQHFWKGRPGLWKALMPANVAAAIARANAGSFSLLGYGCEPDPLLTREEAERHWNAFRGRSVAAGSDS